MSAPRPPRKKPDSSDLVAVGSVGRAHGLKGAFFVSGRVEALPKSYREIWIGIDVESAVGAALVQSSLQGARPIVRIDLCPDRTAAETLTGHTIFVERRLIHAAAQGELTWSDFEGRAVVGSDGILLGRVVGLYNAGSSDVMTIEASDGRSVDLPLAPPYFEGEVHVLNAEDPVRLAVAAACFDELWQPAR